MAENVKNEEKKQEITPKQASDEAVTKEEIDIENMNVYTKLLYVQKHCKAPKSQRNNFGNFNYRTVEDILMALKPLLWKVKATVIIRDEMVTDGQTQTIHLKAIVDFIDCTTGEKVTGTALAKEGKPVGGMSETQNSGAASTYARKIALNGIFLLDDTKDDDFNNTYDNRSQNNGSYQGYQQSQNNGGYQNNQGYQQGSYQNNGYYGGGNNY